MKWTSKVWKRWVVCAVCMTLLFAASALAQESSAVNGDGIALQKTLRATEWENLFEITLGVRVQKNMAEWLYGNTAVVIVLDISNTMNAAYTGSDGAETRIASARAAAQRFADRFLSDEYAELGVQRQLGLVTFHSDAQTVIPLLTREELSAKGDGYVQQTIGAIAAAGKTDPNRYTNMEGGLRLAHNLLDQSGAMFRHIILLTDGFPTTYADTGKDLNSLVSITGYPTADASGRFVNRKATPNLPCLYGTDYSDEGAARAQQEAAAIRADGIYLHTVGVDIGGQTIQQKLDEHAGKPFSTVDCYAQGEYVIGSADSADAYRSWLAGSISGAGAAGTAAGLYADCSSAEQLDAIYGELFKTIRRVSTEAAEGLWVAEDTMGEMMELRGCTPENPHVTEGENGFRWSILNAGPRVSTVDGITFYDYELTYYARLTNEAQGFDETETWPANGPTWFDYRVVETVDGKEVFSEIRRAEFDVPSAEGFLSELAFVKKDGATGEGIAGAVFALTHDAQRCSICRHIEALTRAQGDTQIGPFSAQSDAEGRVVFNNLPSGHEYVLQETRAPEGYQLDAREYDVGVHYDVVTGSLPGDGLVNQRYNRLSVTKQVEATNGWDDPGFAPVFSVQLLRLNGTSGAYDLLQTVQLAAGQTHTFTGLADGTYRIAESQPEAVPAEGWLFEEAQTVVIGADGTERTGDTVMLAGGDEAAMRIVNRYRYTPDRVELTAFKQWDDDDNRDGMRPQSVRFALLVNGLLWGEDGIRDVTVQESGSRYSVQFAYDRRRGEATVAEIGYTDHAGLFHAFGTFDEQGRYVPSAADSFDDLGYTIRYTSDEQGSPVVVNTREPEMVSVRVWKTWDDVESQHIQPVTVRLYADGAEVNRVVLDGSEGWRWTFTHTAQGAPLYRYQQGREIVYHVAEDELGGGYMSEIHAMPGDPYGWLLVNTYRALPLTGDGTRPGLLAALMAASLVGAVVLAAGRRTSRR